jgi:signal transduction histidine kinase
MTPAEPGLRLEGALLDAVDDELRRSEARYRNIFESAAVALWEVNFSLAKRRIEGLARDGMTDFAAYMAEHPEFIREAMDLTIAVDVNEAGMRMLGARTKEELLGPVGKVWPPESEPKFAQTMVAAMERRPTFELETTLRALSGRNVDVLYSVNYPPEALSLESIFVAFSDLTARNQDHAALQKAQADLAHASRLASLGELTASIIHEISQPLAGIKSNAQAGLRWLRRERPDNDAAIASLEGVVDGTKRTEAVIGGIRALAKKQTLQPEDLCLNQVIEETLALLSRELERGRVELDTNLQTEMVPVRADRVQIQQVLINLIMNAAQAMLQSDGPGHRLIVATTMGGDEVTVSVADTGPGVDPALRDRLFTAFVTNKTEGMGLGLSLCASIVDRHGGRIWADLDQPQGATFRFSLPRCDARGQP